ncbi:MAG: hypothetical protein HOM61_04035 [Candidatus Marinimicrobia bacterium]|jgi:hypothetical protein|nr:hypothetical protein [Candidatus Neomarinimicrobiota bacterium]|tara:strand:+ start:85 stop:342 length:258 start_codon:yes stop_codon:yes gene_type:complete
MAIIRQGGYTENDSSDKLKEKRRLIIEEERIFQLNEALLAYLDKLLEEYEIVKKSEEDSDEVVYPDRDELAQYTQDYANSKPKGF